MHDVASIHAASMQTPATHCTGIDSYDVAAVPAGGLYGGIDSPS
jgi:hypothetical protein